MGHKIFVSYKYADDQVANLTGQSNSTVRDYVDELENYFDSSSHIYKGESSGEDLSQLEEETIWSKLRDRIFDSTMTIVFISPGMKVAGVKEKNQWIPWEVSFSLRTTKRKTQSGSTTENCANIHRIAKSFQNGYTFSILKHRFQILHFGSFHRC